MQSIWGKKTYFYVFILMSMIFSFPLFNALNEKYIFGIWPS